MKIRFQADADLNSIIVGTLLRRAPEIDFQSATAAGLEELKDSQVLAIAARENRVLVSHDQSTMPDHFAQFMMTSRSPGVFIVPQHLPVITAVDELLLIWSASEPDEWADRICYLPL